ncbi:ATP-binding protein [Nocardia uniformis]|uniref:ATP-binding protein n=1 Tax=Nocardia uniformis TaxID=53432 RepID=A0A849CJT9_9NOCA|nr:ATP-binding protein [Nocardia uniformis]NNH74951.1 ATP-binding protein [Nocardia uniformis]
MTASSALDSPPVEAHTMTLSALTRRIRGALDTADESSTAASDRILRRLGVSAGIAGIILGLFEVPEIAEQSRVAPHWWTASAVVLVFGFFPILALVSLVAGRRPIKVVSACAALSFLAVVATLPFGLEVHTVNASAVWPSRVLAMAVIAAVLAFPTRWAVAYMLLASAAAAVTTIYTMVDFTPLLFVENFLRAAGLSALFVWCGTAALGAAERVDRESAIAARRAAVAAAAQARDRERSRFAALIHDAVLSTLLEASRAGTESAVVRRQAERTLEQLDESRGAQRDPDLFDARSAVLFLRTAVHEVNPSIRFATRTWPGFDDLRMPVHAASTLAAALTEAVRNSLRHASVPGREVRRTVTATVSAGSIRIVFTDDGAGFDLAQVPADRLGISVSIMGRMRQLAGGSAFVESQPGEGTTVTLVWGGDGSH